MTQDGFRVADTYRTAQEKGHIGQAVNEVQQACNQALASIPSGLTCVNETDWGKIQQPENNRIYLVFPDEQVSES